MLSTIRRALAVTALLLTVAAGAQEAFPTKTIRFVVPYGPGATTDLMARMVAEKVRADLGQPVIVDNRAGASGMIGSEYVARAAPDGYTILLGTDATHTSTPLLQKNSPFDPVNDVTPITLAAKNLIVLAINPSLPVNSVSELIAYAKKNPGQLSYGSSGNGSPHHLAGILFNEMAGTDIQHIAYKGGGPAVVDMLGGHLPVAFSSLASVMPHLKSGKLKVLALTEKARVPGFPDIPVVAETLPGFEMGSWLAFLGPRGLAPDVVAKLNQAIVKGLRSPDVMTKLNEAGLLVVASSPEEFAAQLNRDYEARGRMIAQHHIHAD